MFESNLSAMNPNRNIAFKKVISFSRLVVVVVVGIGAQSSERRVLTLSARLFVRLKEQHSEVSLPVGVMMVGLAGTGSVVAEHRKILPGWL